jgi:hypothetical protein
MGEGRENIIPLTIFPGVETPGTPKPFQGSAGWESFSIFRSVSRLSSSSDMARDKKTS